MTKDNGKGKSIRCVVYTRKGTDENLDLDFKLVGRPARGG